MLSFRVKDAAEVAPEAQCTDDAHQGQPAAGMVRGGSLLLAGSVRMLFVHGSNTVRTLPVSLLQPHVFALEQEALFHQTVASALDEQRRSPSVGRSLEAGRDVCPAATCRVDSPGGEQRNGVKRKAEQSRVRLDGLPVEQPERLLCAFALPCYAVRVVV